jgi:hypothetical protein
MKAIIGIVGCLLSLAGCVTITQPPNGSGHLDPVPVVVVWNTSMTPGTFFATLDGNDVTSQFTVDYAANQATAQITAAPIAHTLVAGGTVSYFLYSATSSSTVTFTVLIQ